MYKFQYEDDVLSPNKLYISTVMKCTFPYKIRHKKPPITIETSVKITITRSLVRGTYDVSMDFYINNEFVNYEYITEQDTAFLIEDIFDKTTPKGDLLPSASWQLAVFKDVLNDKKIIKTLKNNFKKCYIFCKGV